MRVPWRSTRTKVSNASSRSPSGETLVLFEKNPDFAGAETRRTAQPEFLWSLRTDDLHGSIIGCFDRTIQNAKRLSSDLLHNPPRFCHRGLPAPGFAPAWSGGLFLVTEGVISFKGRKEMGVNMRTRILARISLVMVATLALVAPASAPQAADEIGVSASVLHVMQTNFTAPGSGSSLPVTLMSGTFTNTLDSDLTVHVAGECALWSDIASPESQTAAQVVVWVGLDGGAVAVSRDSNGDGIADDPDDGKVVWCNRAFKTAAPAADVASLFQKSRAANAFRWIALAVVAGTHTLEVKAQLDATVTDVGTFAQAAIGKRTLLAGGAAVGPVAGF